MPLAPDRRPRRRNTFMSNDIDRDLTAMKGGPLFTNQRDPEFSAFVDRQFSRAFGQRPAQTDATGRMVQPEPATRELEIFQPRLRPNDTRLGNSVGRTGRNRPEDVQRVQRGLSNAGTFSFDVPRERTGRASEGLFQGIEAFQRENGLQVDGLMRPLGETIVTLGRAFGPVGDSGIDAGLNLGSSRGELLSGVGNALGFAGSSGPGSSNEIGSAEDFGTLEFEEGSDDAQRARCERLRERFEQLRESISVKRAEIKEWQREIKEIESQLRELEVILRGIQADGNTGIPTPRDRRTTILKAIGEGAANFIFQNRQEDIEKKISELKNKREIIGQNIERTNASLKGDEEQMGEIERELYENCGSF